jgi:hypothetical protein
VTDRVIKTGFVGKIEVESHIRRIREYQLCRLPSPVANGAAKQAQIYGDVTAERFSRLTMLTLKNLESCRFSPLKRSHTDSASDVGSIAPPVRRRVHGPSSVRSPSRETVSLRQSPNDADFR